MRDKQEAWNSLSPCTEGPKHDWDPNRGRNCLACGFRIRPRKRFSPRVIQKLFRKQEGRCAYCDVSLVFEERTTGSPTGWSLDHVIPMTRGGKDSIKNIVIACNECNLDKDDMLLDEWLELKEKRNGIS